MPIPITPGAVNMPNGVAFSLLYNIANATTNYMNNGRCQACYYNSCKIVDEKYGNRKKQQCNSGYSKSMKVVCVYLTNMPNGN
ncbi:MAG: hypothetical protein V9E96_09900 [Chitinophagaceae bacterium]